LNTKLIMSCSSLVLGLAGAACLFAPEELAAGFGANVAFLPVLIQLAGALYLGFAMANWTAKGSSIGGIYGRPLSMANLTHFAIGTLALLRFVLTHRSSAVTNAVLIVYALFAVLFAYVVFVASPGSHPKSSRR
jgi:hypothetical protein